MTHQIQVPVFSSKGVSALITALQQSAVGVRSNGGAAAVSASDHTSIEQKVRSGRSGCATGTGEV